MEVTHLTKTTLPSESAEQIGFLAWFGAQFPTVRIFHVPNGGYRSPSVAKRLKTEGVKAGVPDLFVPAWRLWVEMKRVKGGVVSAEQKDWIAYLESVGYTVIIGRGAEDASRQVLGFVDGKKKRGPKPP